MMKDSLEWQIMELEQMLAIKRLRNALIRKQARQRSVRSRKYDSRGNTKKVV